MHTFGRYVRPLALSFTCLSSPAGAWGERGHDTVTRVATRLLADHEDPATAAWGRLLARREHMLAHVSNVPDIVWRRLGPDVDSLNAPSHFIDLEYILAPGNRVERKDLPKDFAEFKQRIERNCKRKVNCAPGETLQAKIEKTGHAPFRIEQLSYELTQALSRLKTLEADPKASDAQKATVMDEALLYAGLLSHFIGDLANPHHTTIDYDGWLSDQGGLHSYFESDLLDHQDLGLEQAVLEDARRHRPAHTILQGTNDDPLQMGWALTVYSHGYKEALHALDRRHALLSKSQASTRQRATRRPPEAVAIHFRDFHILRLAVGADVLASYWRIAWNKAGKPDVSFYRTYTYPVQPDFIPLSYDVEAKPGR